MTERAVDTEQSEWERAVETAEAGGHADWFAEAPAKASARFGGVLTIDLEAIKENYRILRAHAPGAAVGAVVKADAYGLGVERVAPALAAAGCETFFVAHVDEGITLRNHVPAPARILVLNGAAPGAEADCLARRLEPVLNCREQFEAWREIVTRRGIRAAVTLQFDTGLSRFGHDLGEAGWLRDALDASPNLTAGLVMSHLACADTPEDPANAPQLRRMKALQPSFPRAKFSLCASSGIFLGSPYRFDLVRPGAALYGVAPVAGQPNSMMPVVGLQGRVMQVRTVSDGSGIGYGHVGRATGPTRLATVAVGYADGLLRSLSQRGSAWLGALRLPIVGRVSMDSVIVDVGRAPEGAIRHGGFLDLIGPHHGVDDVARAAGTIGYEILTSFGRRYERRYRPLGSFD